MRMGIVGITGTEIDFYLKQIGIKAIEAVECVKISNSAFACKLGFDVPYFTSEIYVLDDGRRRNAMTKELGVM
jgi:hypothetical protein